MVERKLIAELVVGALALGLALYFFLVIFKILPFPNLITDPELTKALVSSAGLRCATDFLSGQVSTCNMENYFAASQNPQILIKCSGQSPLFSCSDSNQIKTVKVDCSASDKCTIYSFELPQFGFITNSVLGFLPSIPYAGPTLSSMATSIIGATGTPKFVLYDTMLSDGVEEAWTPTAAQNIYFAIALGGVTNIGFGFWHFAGTAITHGVLVVAGKEEGQVFKAIVSDVAKQEFGVLAKAELINFGKAAASSLIGRAENEFTNGMVTKLLASSGGSSLRNMLHDVVFQNEIFGKVLSPEQIDTLDVLAETYMKRVSQQLTVDVSRGVDQATFSLYAKLDPQTMKSLWLDAVDEVANNEKDDFVRALYTLPDNTNINPTTVTTGTTGITYGQQFSDITSSVSGDFDNLIAPRAYNSYLLDPSISTKLQAELDSMISQQETVIKEVVDPSSGSGMLVSLSNLQKDSPDLAGAIQKQMDADVAQAMPFAQTDYIKRMAFMSDAYGQIINDNGVKKTVFQYITDHTQEWFHNNIQYPLNYVSLSQNVKNALSYFLDKSNYYAQGFTGISNLGLNQKTAVSAFVVAAALVYDYQKNIQSIHDTCGDNSLCLHGNSFLLPPGNNSFNFSFAKQPTIKTRSIIPGITGSTGTIFDWIISVFTTQTKYTNGAVLVSPCKTDLSVQKDTKPSSDTKIPYDVIGSNNLAFYVRKNVCACTANYPRAGEHTYYLNISKYVNSYLGRCPEDKTELIAPPDSNDSACQSYYVTDKAFGTQTTDMQVGGKDYSTSLYVMNANDCTKYGWWDSSNPDYVSCANSKFYDILNGDGVPYDQQPQLYEVSIQPVNIQTNSVSGQQNLISVPQPSISGINQVTLLGSASISQQTSVITVDPNFAALSKYSSEYPDNYCLLNQAKTSDWEISSCKIAPVVVSLIFTGGVAGAVAPAVAGAAGAACEIGLSGGDRWPATQ